MLRQMTIAVWRGGIAAMSVYGLLLAATPRADASVIVPAEHGSYSYSVGNIVQIGNYSSGNISVSGAGYSVSQSVGPIPYVSAYVTSSAGLNLLTHDAQSLLSYYFMVSYVDPLVNSVLVNINGIMSSDATGYGGGTGEIIVRDSVTQSALFDQTNRCSQNPNDLRNNFGCTTSIIDTNLSVRTNQVYEIQINASSNAETLVNASQFSSGSIYVDPSISIASSVPNASGYSIILSGGVANPPIRTLVPEPASLPLMLGGLIAIGATAWRRAMAAGIAIIDGLCARSLHRA